MKDVTIRFIREADLENFVQLCKLHADYEQSEYSTEHKAERLHPYIFSDVPSVYCLVAEQNGTLIGFASYMKQFSTWNAEFYIYMDCLFMKEEARGFGIGERLVDKIKEEGAKEHCTQIQWQTPDFNVRAMKFYNRIGATSKSKERFFLEI